jgi:hypothetical protein
MKQSFWVCSFLLCHLAGAAQVPGGVSGNLKLWLRADAGVFSNAGVTAANNNATIQQWNDYSTLGNNASQTTIADRPTFKNNATDKIAKACLFRQE